MRRYAFLVRRDLRHSLTLCAHQQFAVMALDFLRLLRIAYK
jgi:hypothetical protein